MRRELFRPLPAPKPAASKQRRRRWEQTKKPESSRREAAITPRSAPGLLRSRLAQALAWRPAGELAAFVEGIQRTTPEPLTEGHIKSLAECEQKLANVVHGTRSVPWTSMAVGMADIQPGLVADMTNGVMMNFPCSPAHFMMDHPDKLGYTSWVSPEEGFAVPSLLYTGLCFEPLALLLSEAAASHRCGYVITDDWHPAAAKANAGGAKTPAELRQAGEKLEVRIGQGLRCAWMPTMAAAKQAAQFLAEHNTGFHECFMIHSATVFIFQSIGFETEVDRVPFMIIANHHLGNSWNPNSYCSIAEGAALAVGAMFPISDSDWEFVLRYVFSGKVALTPKQRQQMYEAALKTLSAGERAAHDLHLESNPRDFDGALHRAFSHRGGKALTIQQAGAEVQLHMLEEERTTAANGQGLALALTGVRSRHEPIAPLRQTDGAVAKVMLERRDFAETMLELQRACGVVAACDRKLKSVQLDIAEIKRKKGKGVRSVVQPSLVAAAKELNSETHYYGAVDPGDGRKSAGAAVKGKERSKVGVGGTL